MSDPKKPKANFGSLLEKKGPILKSAPEIKPERVKPVSAKKLTPKKPKAERANKRVQVLLTQSEYDKLSAKAGAVPMSKYLRMALKDAGEI